VTPLVPGRSVSIKVAKNCGCPAAAFDCCWKPLGFAGKKSPTRLVEVVVPVT